MSPLKRPLSDLALDKVMAVEGFGHDKAVTYSLENSDEHIASPSKNSVVRSPNNVSGDDVLPLGVFLDEGSLDSSFVSEDDRQDLTAEDEQIERDIFHNARQYLKSGPLLRRAIHLYGERKLLTFFYVHTMCTMVIWGEFR
jgi:hypothetical protein